MDFEYVTEMMGIFKKETDESICILPDEESLSLPKWEDLISADPTKVWSLGETED